MRGLEIIMSVTTAFCTSIIVKQIQFDCTKLSYWLCSEYRDFKVYYSLFIFYHCRSFIFSSFYFRPMLSEKPDIVVGTPSRLLAHIQAGNLNIKESLEMIVIDEADLVFSFGHEENVKAVLR